MKSCPCCSGKLYAECCEIYHTLKAVPSTPEALMRSRYSAYALQKMTYIKKTMCGKAAQGFNANEALLWSRQVKWQRLEVIFAENDQQMGWVEFKAFYSLAGKDCCLHEKSEFHFIDGRWFYTGSI